MSASSSLFRLNAVLVGALVGIVAYPWLAVPCALFALFEVRKIGREATRASEALRHLQRGDFNCRLVGISDRGPIGRLLRDINNFADRSDAFVREAKASLDGVAEHHYYRRLVERGMLGDFKLAAQTINRASAAMGAKVAQFSGVADSFETRLTGIAGTVGAASSQLQSTAGALAQNADRSRVEAVAVSAASEQASANVQTVAAAAEQLSSSISEISSQVARSADLSASATRHVRATEGQVAALTEAASHIGDVVNLIQDIAAQTNLLALNATIEAARAGEAGKGFAVVANEVKHLANQTARATEDIVGQVSAIQGATGSAVTAIRSVTNAVGEVDQAMQSIAAAVEQQAAATREIARNVEEASAGTGEVSARIVGVRNAADDTGSGAGEVLHAARELSRQSNALGEELGGFLVELRKVV